MSTTALPTLKLAHDDNLAVFTRPQATTLVLAADSYNVTDAVVNVETPKLTIYAETLRLAPLLPCPGKVLEFHCNNLELAEPVTVDVTGAAGQSTPGDNSEGLAQGRPGGNVVFHIHNLRLHVSKDALTFWPQPLTLKIVGGVGAKYTKIDQGNTIDDMGKAGTSGTVSILYSNSLLRAHAAVSDAYNMSTSVPARLGALRTHCLPVLEKELKDATSEWPAIADIPWLKTILEKWKDEFQDLKSKINSCFDLHQVFVKCAELLGNATLPTETAASVQNIKEFLTTVSKLKDYSTFPDDLSTSLVSLQEPLSAWIELKPSTPPDQRNLALKFLQSTFKTAEAAAEKTRAVISEADTPLALAVKRNLDSILTELTKAETASKAMCDDPTRITMSAISFTSEAVESLSMNLPLVHPDQCNMVLRRADAAFFAEDFVTAQSIYKLLLERLSFVPFVASNKVKDATTFEHWPQYLGLQNMEQEEKLSLWTLETLTAIHTQAKIRAEQLSTGVDLFNLRAGWAPRLSFRYYLDYAVQQLERLKIYEASYWQFFDNYQAQMEADASLRSAQVASIHQTRDTEERLKSSVEAFQKLGVKIDSEKAEYNSKAKKLQDELKAVEKELREYRYENPQAIVNVISTLAVGGVMTLMGPVGWIGAGLMATSAISQTIGVFEDREAKVEDASGVAINKDHIITQLHTWDDDMGSILKASAYTRNADGTKTADAASASKLLVTETQVKTLLTQFKGKFSHNEALGKALDEFVTESRNRNENIIAYNNAVLDCYQQMAHRALLDKQGRGISSQLIKESQGLPSIVSYYQRLRDTARLAILRTIKHSVLALSFWGLHKDPKFASPGLLSSVDEIEAHIAVLLNSYEVCLTEYASVTPVSWPVRRGQTGILYRLSREELRSLTISSHDPYAVVSKTEPSSWVKSGGKMNKDTAPPTPQMFTTIISGLQQPARARSSLAENPFAGFANVRLSQISFCAPGLRFVDQTPIPRVLAELRHEGIEQIVDPDDVVHKFEHHAVNIISETDGSATSMPTDNLALSRQYLGSDWDSSNLNAKTQAPIGPFAAWRIVLREQILGGVLDWSAVTTAWLIFEGSGVPFRL